MASPDGVDDAVLAASALALLADLREALGDLGDVEAAAAGLAVAAFGRGLEPAAGRLDGVLFALIGPKLSGGGGIRR